MPPTDAQQHWDGVYASMPVERTAWYEAHPEPSLVLLERCEIGLDEPVVDVGSGASTFIDALLERGYLRVIAIDISAHALDALSKRLGAERALVEMVVDDVTQPGYLDRIRDVALWHDRALLHFLTDPDERAAYVETLRSALRPGGYAIIAHYAPDAPDECSGLDVVHADAHALTELLGIEFELLEAFEYSYTAPSGEERPFLYTLFRRLSPA